MIKILKMTEADKASVIFLVNGEWLYISVPLCYNTRKKTKEG